MLIPNRTFGDVLANVAALLLGVLSYVGAIVLGAVGGLVIAWCIVGAFAFGEWLAWQLL